MEVFLRLGLSWQNYGPGKGKQGRGSPEKGLLISQIGNLANVEACG